MWMASASCVIIVASWGNRVRKSEFFNSEAVVSKTSSLRACCYSLNV